jgi:pimeloyl-ACP methyl ester carboxylesterase
MSIQQNFGRRGLLAAGGAVLFASAARARPADDGDAGWRVYPAQTTWAAPPPIAPAREGLVSVGDVRLWRWDTGGAGEAIVLLHPFTGSDAIWGYQAETFAKAGYRVIGYSRRGFGGSEAGARTAPGSAVDDLDQLLKAMSVDRFHLVGSAAGGFIGPDYALTHPGRLLSLTLANTLAGVTDPDYQRDTEALIPSGFQALPADFRELSGSYRIAYPEGARLWRELEQVAAPAGPVVQRLRNNITLAALTSIDCPVLLLTGDSDPFMPPARLRRLGQSFRRAQLAVLSESGHSGYWEQPSAFNQALLSFLRARR